MSQLKLTNTTQMLPSYENPNKTLLKQPRTPHFTAQPLYLDRTLIHMDFVPTESTTYSKTLVHTDDKQDTHKYKFIILAVLCLTLTYFLCAQTTTNDTEVNMYVMSSLVQLGNDPAVSTSVIKILDYSLL